MDDLGVSGNAVIFSVDGLNMYQTTAISPQSVAGMSDASIGGLIAAGQATPIQMTYLAQFPWTVPVSG